MKPAKTSNLSKSAEDNTLVNASKSKEVVTGQIPLTAKFKGLVQTAKGKWHALGKGEVETLAQDPVLVAGHEAERLAADAAAAAPSPVTPVAEAAIQASASVEAPVYDQLSGTLQGLLSPSDISALVQDTTSSSVATASASGVSTFANPMDMGPVDWVLGQAPAGAGSAAGGAGSAAGAGGAASSAAAGSAAGATAAGAASAGAAAGAGAVAAGAGAAISAGALVAGVKATSKGFVTETLVLDSAAKTARVVRTQHLG